MRDRPLLCGQAVDLTVDQLLAQIVKLNQQRTGRTSSVTLFNAVAYLWHLMDVTGQTASDAMIHSPRFPTRLCVNKGSVGYIISKSDRRVSFKKQYRIGHPTEKPNHQTKWLWHDGQPDA